MAVITVGGRAGTDDAVQKLKRAGADRVISPYQIGAVPTAGDRAPAAGGRFRRTRDQL
jgi:hypothetical protein